MVTFYEFDGSPTEQYTDDGGFIAKRRLQCAWSDRYSLLSYVAQGPGAVYPYQTSFNAYAIGATILPFGDNPMPNGAEISEMQYDTAVLTVTYAYTYWYPQAISGRMTVEEMHPALEYRTLAKDKMYAATSSGNVLNMDTHVLLPSFDYILTSYGHVALSAAAMNLMGYVNTYAWQTLFLGVVFNEERMLYMGPAPRIEARLGLKPTMCVTQLWKVRAQPWTMDYTENGWETIYNNAGDKLYPSANFSILYPWSMP
jgi:hypothetical protein